MNVHFEEAVCSEKKRIFSLADLALVDLQKVPQHIAIIMDGNRRWAKQKNLPLMMGHWEGAETLTEIVRAASEIGVKTLTVYAFSTENWQRTDDEVKELMHLFQVYLVKNREFMVQEGTSLHAIGDLSKLPEKVRETFEETRVMTQKGRKINLVLAMNYGSRDELRRAVTRLFKEYEQTKFNPESLTEESIAKYLDTSAWRDPDLLIRTSGEHRVSNFLLWQISYAELYITDVLWPEFDPKELLRAVVSYQTRTRRLGV
jgi:undecaprenyl diphosphate synthase